MITSWHDLAIRLPPQLSGRPRQRRSPRSCRRQEHPRRPRTLLGSRRDDQGYAGAPCAPSARWATRWSSSTRPTSPGRPSSPKTSARLMDDLGIRCNSTHNGPQFHRRRHRQGDRAEQDSRRQVHRDGQRRPRRATAGRLEKGRRHAHLGAARSSARRDCARAITITRPSSNRWTASGPMDVIAANTPKDFMLQFDVGTCVEVGQDPVAWINANPGRINSPAPEGLGRRRRQGLPASCSAKATRRGRRSSTPPKARAAWSST